LGTSRTIAVVGLRTPSDAGWRADLGSALAFVVSHPETWLLGMLGFALRGGIVLLVAPLIVLPTQVEARQALGANIGSTGLTDGFGSLVAGAALVSGLVLLAVLYVLARVEIAGFSRLVSDPASAEQRGWRSSWQLGRAERGALTARVFIVQSAGAAALLLAAVPLVFAARDATFAEVLAPTSASSIFTRVAAHLAAEVIMLIVAIGIVELITSALSRALLRDAYGLDGRRRSHGATAQALTGAARDLLGHPVRTVAYNVLRWCLLAAALIGATWLLGFVWQATRAIFLSGSAAGEPHGLATYFVAAVLLAAAFAIGLVTCGVVAAFRSALASLASLR
jgi:hypothetical protein